MKLTKRQLRKIIKEEKTGLLEYGSLDAYGPDDYTTYVITPIRFVEAAEEYLTDEELASIGREKIERIAIDRANELAWETAGSMEGFGSSDRAAYIKYFLDDLGRYAGFKTDWKGPRGSLQVVREETARLTKNRLRRIIKEEVKKFHLKEYDSGSPPPSWYEPDYGPEDTRPSANVDEIVQYFISDVVGKVDTSEFMEPIAKKVHDNDESWGDHEGFVNDPRVQEAMLNDPDVQEEIAAGGSIEDLLSEESFDFHYELADERAMEHEEWERFDREVP